MRIIKYTVGLPLIEFITDEFEVGKFRKKSESVGKLVIRDSILKKPSKILAIAGFLGTPSQTFKINALKASSGKDS
jgi:hypothetical protein